MDFLSEQRILYVSNRYSPIYDHFADNYNIKPAQLFLICASIGFRNLKKTTISERGKEFRTTYYDTNSKKSAVYTILLSDPELGKDIKQFADAEYKRKAMTALESYAEGGMDILTEEVFRSNWDGHKLDDTYKEYDVDIVNYINTSINKVPF